MKKAILFLFFFAALASVAVGQNPNDWFITVWKPNGTTISFYATGNGYTLKCVQLDGSGNEIPATMQTFTGVNGNYTITTGITAGQKYRIYAYGGTFNKVNFFNSNILLKVEQWGTTVWSYMSTAFYGCENMDVTATDKPNLSACQDLSNMFYDCKSLVNTNGSISSWSTANVTNMESMFQEATSFNQPLNWNTANVTSMSSMFYRATSFNQPIGNWNTANVTNMEGMFQEATSFNQPLNSWNTTEVTNMSNMFREATSFNQPLNNWNTANVTDMNCMFMGATSFNQPLSNWNTQNVAEMHGMFYGATSFNQPVGNFRINTIFYDMGDMLYGCGMSCENLSTTLDGWKTQAATLNKNNINLGNFNTDQYYNQMGQTAITALTVRGWTITGGTYAADCLTPKSWFITVWEPEGTTIYFNATGNGYTLKCVQLNSVGNEIPATMQTFTGVNGSYTITTGITAGQKYRIYAYGGTFNKVGFFYSKTLLKVEQWGTTQWATMNRAFYKCENMDVTAPDKPNLSAVTDMSEMFYECYKLVNANGSMKNWNTANVTDMNSMFFGSFLFNQDISGWNVSNVTNMKAMFAYAKIFNQDISRWNVSKVTNMRAMFSNTEAFNQDISGWDVSHVTYMNSMFYETKVFNQNINSWDVSSVTDISYMFYKAKAFNQPLNNWDVSHVENINNTFGYTEAFNQDISGWNVSRVTSMEFTFCGSKAFNQPLDSWDVSHVKYMYYLFSGAKKFNQPLNNWRVDSVMSMGKVFMNAIAFNQPLNNWNTARVTDMESMFEGATAFNQPLNNWRTDSVTNMNNMFKGATAFDQPLDNFKINALSSPFAPIDMFQGCGMSCQNLSTTLDSWKTQAATLNKNNIDLGDISTVPNMYNETGRDAIAALTARGWTITGGRFARGCISPDYFVTEWDMSKPYGTGSTTKLRTNLYGNNFVVEYININDPTDKGINTNVTAGAWSQYTITGLNPTGKYRIIAYPNPNIVGSSLSLYGRVCDYHRLRKVTQWGTYKWGATSLEVAFELCHGMDVTATDVPDLTNVTSLKETFAHCDSLVYNPSINNWDVSNVTNMHGTFANCYKFNQPLNSWNTSNVTTMKYMLRANTSFDHPLDSFRINSIATTMEDMLEDCGMSCENRSKTLDSWSTQAANLGKNGINLGNLDRFYTTQYYNQTGQAAIAALQGRGWTITGGTYAEDCLTPNSWFTTVWDITKPTDRTINNPYSTIAFPCIGSGYTLYWEDVDNPTPPGKHGTVTVTTSPYYLAVPSGTTKVRIKAHKGKGTLSTILHDVGGVDPKRLIAVEQWGTTKWTTFDRAFYGCENMDVTASDKPDLSACQNLSRMFFSCRSLANANGSISGWQTQNITNMERTFLRTTAFNKPLNNWNTAEVTNMNGMFQESEFNQSLDNWNTSKVTNMGSMFYGNTAFNQPLNSWDVSKVTDMNNMFGRATSFNQDISSWNTGKVTDMWNMFLFATAFNQPLDNWNTAEVTNMINMFYGATAFNQPLNSWNTAKVTNMSSMFNIATSFNQPLNSWNTAKVTNMSYMFYGATSFNQRLDSFKINDITAMESMFSNCGMSCENLSTTLDGWKTQATALGKNNINLGDITTVPNMYNETGKAAINVLKNNHNWTIIGGRFAPDCVSPDYYVSMWDMSRPATTGTATNLVTNLWGSSFRVEWKNLDDGTTGSIASANATTAPLTITGLTAGKRYRVVAYPNSTPGSILKKLATEDGGGITRTDVARLDSVTQWGVNKWMSLEGAFRHCSRMDVTTTDVPDLTTLSGNKSFNFMFEGCENLVYNSTINNWVTTGVTDMSRMFSGAKAFNQPLDGWDVSNVKYMASMFFKAEAFNQDLNSWQTGNVERMQDMFNSAKAFNGNITTWNTGKVTNMRAMFYGAEAFNKNINGWDVSNVTDMSSMFQNAKAFTGGGAFYNAYGRWNVEKVTTMENMFAGAESFSEDLGQWTLRSITNMRNMFSAPAGKGMTCADYSHSLHGWARNPLTKTGVDFTGQLNRVYNAIGKIARDSLAKPVAQGGRGWTISGDSYDELCGLYVWTGNVSTDVADINNWQDGNRPSLVGTPGGYEDHRTVFVSSTAARDMHITRGTVTPPYTPGGPNQLEYWLFDNLINRTNKKVVVEPGANLYISFDVYGSSTPADADKIVIKADDTNPNGTLILNGQPCDKPVYATVEMYSKAYKSTSPVTWTDNIPTSPTKGDTMSASYKWQYIGVPVEGEVANAFYGSYLRKYDETYNDPNHYYGKWRKIGSNETWQPLVPFAGYEVTSRTPKVYVFKGRLLHCPQELTLTRQAAEVTAVASSVTDPRYRRWELGRNLFGNSYTAALNISNGKLFVDLEASYAIGREPIEATVYIYNTGSVADWNGGSTGSGAGQYVAVPMRNATLLSEQYISSMQGFMLKFKEDTLQLKGIGNPVKFRIGLTEQDFTGTYPFGGNQRPQRAPQADPSDLVHGFLKIGLTSRRSVSSVHLVEAEGTTDEFDNGWDGMQLNTGRSSSATLFVPSEYGDLQVSTSDNIVGDRFGIVNNGDTTYRLTVIRHRLDNRGELYLYDVATNRYTLLDADTTVYDFTSEGSGNVDKRFVITDRRNADDPNTAVDEAADDMSLYGYIDGRNTLVVNNHTSEAGTLTLLDVSGKAVYTSRFGVGFSRHDLSHLPAGVYIARLEASVRRATVKAITMK